MYPLTPCSSTISKDFFILPSVRTSSYYSTLIRPRKLRARAQSEGLDTSTMSGSTGEDEEGEGSSKPPPPPPSVVPDIDKDIKKVVQKTAATFAPRASTASKNPAVPGTALYTVFEVQGYASMLLGGALSFNLIFPSNEPDIWRLMGMWSIWMFTIPSLRARDCSKNEKEALNYLFLVIPLLNVLIPFFWKSFSVVWSADTIAFFMMYAWKLGWLQKSD
ncbi:protein RESISTANCE TO PHYTOPHTHORA 1, chloroplastic [Typha latifolia]|uniref:protein RESISTANCE TO PHYTOPHTHORA 1, chloroplastic n=1 Tax=Typha latifolia TaxID=4733 RepID=UPI003C2AD35B